jgi:hypothetical protein
MSDILVKILVKVLAVVALATKQINQGRFSKPVVCGYSLAEHVTEKFTKKILGESDVEAILQRLDRLTQEEACITAAHTLEVVHGLFNNLKEVMDGTQVSFGVLTTIDNTCLSRLQGLNGWHTTVTR